MPSARYRFEGFELDPQDRRLRRDGAPVELNTRYLDALALLVRERGKLVTKERFLDDVWRGVPVTDEALTQCIRTLRRQLGDDAAKPRFIETVPKHGYRFIAAVDLVEGGELPAPKPAWRPPTVPQPPRPTPASPPLPHWWRVLLLGAAGTIGGGVAGFVGGLFYGFGGAAQPLGAGSGAASTVLVLLCLTIVVGLMGGAGVGFGIAAAGLAAGRRRMWIVLGGAGGGLVVGGVIELLGLDAFNILLGRAPGDITGGAEGVMLGAAAGIGAWLGARPPEAMRLRRSVTAAGLAGSVVGMLIPPFGGRLMGGSLELLSRSFPDSRLRLDRIGTLFGESGFGPVSEIVTGGLEGLLFSTCVVGAMLIALRQFDEVPVLGAHRLRGD